MCNLIACADNRSTVHRWSKLELHSALFLSKCIDKCCFNWSINFCILSIRHICLTLKWLPKSWANTLSSVFWQEFPLSSAADRYVSSSIGELFILHPRPMFVEETWTRYCKDLLLALRVKMHYCHKNQFLANLKLANIIDMCNRMSES